MGPWLRPATLPSLTYSNGVSSPIPQDDLGELPFPFPDGFNICPDVCFRVGGLQLPLPRSAVRLTAL